MAKLNVIFREKKRNKQGLAPVVVVEIYDDACHTNIFEERESLKYSELFSIFDPAVQPPIPQAFAAVQNLLRQ